jgi:SHS2 domain-containing protein
MSIPYERIAHTADVAIRVYGRDVPELFVHEVERETYRDFTLDGFTPTLLTTTLTGGPTVRRIKGIKAATYHDLEIRETPAGVEADVVFDV